MNWFKIITAALLGLTSIVAWPLSMVYFVGLSGMLTVAAMITVTLLWLVLLDKRGNGVMCAGIVGLAAVFVVMVGPLVTAFAFGAGLLVLCVLVAVLCALSVALEYTSDDQPDDQPDDHAEDDEFITPSEQDTDT